VGHFTTTETQGYLSLVAVFDETTQVAQLDLVIAFVGARTEFYFLDLNDFLLGLGFLLTLLFLLRP
jgi:hypothetical protein